MIRTAGTQLATEKPFKNVRVEQLLAFCTDLFDVGLIRTNVASEAAAACPKPARARDRWRMLKHAGHYLPAVPGYMMNCPT